MNEKRKQRQRVREGHKAIEVRDKESKRGRRSETEVDKAKEKGETASGAK